MNDEIFITCVRSNEYNLPVVTCFERDDERINYLRVSYVGKSAEELIKIVTEQGYLEELLERKETYSRPLNKVTVHFRDGSGEDEIYMHATNIVLDDPEYLIFTNDSYMKVYFNKKDVIYFEMEADRG